MQKQSKSFCKEWLGLGAALLCVATPRADSIWTDEVSYSLVSDKKARAVGDIITVVVQESISAKKDNSTTTAKKTDTSASLDSFLFSAAAGGPTASGFLSHKGKLPAMKVTSDNNFEGKGGINNSETITHRFGVRVVDVLPNGNMIVEGLRQTYFSQESKTVILRGIVRQHDITSNNTVFSYNLADVSIKMMDSGAISNSQKKGWFSRAWDVLTPF